MPKTEQTFTNRTKNALFIYIEPNPDCYKLQPGDVLTVTQTLPEGCNLGDIAFASDEEVVISPADHTNAYSTYGHIAPPTILINGKPVDGLSWNWNREDGPRSWQHDFGPKK